MSKKEKVTPMDYTNTHQGKHARTAENRYQKSFTMRLKEYISNRPLPVKTRCRGNTEHMTTWRNKGYGWGQVAVDEAHKGEEEEVFAVVIVKNVGHNVYRWILTGTPFEMGSGREEHRKQLIACSSDKMITIAKKHLRLVNKKESIHDEETKCHLRQLGNVSKLL